MPAYSFDPPVKGGYEQDEGKHRRNWRGLQDYLDTPFVDSSRLAPDSVTAEAIADGSISDAMVDDVSVSKLTSGTFTADAILAGSWATADTGVRVEFDAAGLRLTDGSTDTVVIPTVGSPVFRGSLIADSITIYSGVIESGGALDLASGTSNPSSAPAIIWDYDYVVDEGTDQTRVGLEHVTGSSRYYYCSTSNTKLYGVDNSTGALEMSMLTRFGGNDYTPKGVTVMSGVLYLLVEFSGNFYLASYSSLTESNFANTLAWKKINGDLIGTDPVLAGLTNDGTDLCVGYYGSSSGDMRVAKFNSSLTFQSGVLLESGFFTGNKKAFDLTHQSTDGGTWWVCWGNTSTGAYAIRAYTSTPARLSAEDFSLPSNTRGIDWNGSVFATNPHAEQRVRIHSSWRSSSSYVHVKYAWYDNTNTYESLASAQSYLGYVQRAKMRVTVPSFPGTADRVRIYALEDNAQSSPAAGAMKRQSTVSTTTTTLSSYSSGGAADRTTSTFPTGGSVGRITGTALEIKGDGTGRWDYIMPPGAIMAYGGSAAPAGWLLCDGAAVSRTTYADLFTAISTTYGVGNGTTTFNVPDLRQRFPLGKATSGTGSTLGGTGGNIDHAHGSPTSGPSATNDSITAGGATSVAGPSHTHTINTGNPPFQVVNFIIKI